MPETDTHPLHDGMQEATRLTRAGRLTEATALIQRTLRGGHEAPPARSAAGPAKVASTVVGTVRHADGGHTRNTAGTHARTTAPPSDRSAGPTPVTGRFVTGSLTNRTGTRSYKLYIPGAATDLVLPLIVMLHGCTQDADDFAAGTRMNALADEHGFLVVYPQQSSQANPSRCWNWFKASEQQRGNGEPSIIADITREVAATYKIDAHRIHVAGMSAGAAMAMTMATTHPELYAAVGVHSGLAYGAASDLPSAVKVMRHGPETPTDQPPVPGRTKPAGRSVPVIVFHGDHDQTVNQRNAEQVLRESVSGGVGAATPLLSVHEGRQPGGLAYTRYVYREGDGGTLAEGWSVHGLGHAWSGGASAGSYTDPRGPDASAHMVRFFTEHPRPR
jgi:poly(hydroxyalkanoate) depolymerase family esterase